MAQFKKMQNVARFAAKTAKRTVHSVECNDTNVLPAESNFKINAETTSVEYSGMNTHANMLPFPFSYVVTG